MRIVTSFFFFLCIQCIQWSCVAGAGIPTRAKFLIISAPRTGQINYVRLQGGGAVPSLKENRQGPLEPLITGGLSSPQGIAVDQKRGRLLVTDPAAQQLFAYSLSVQEGKLVAGAPTALTNGTEARWVAVDGFGNIFLSEEARNQILKIPIEQALRGTPPQVVYDGRKLPQLSAPGGVAVDSFHTYWVNKVSGNLVGSVVRGAQAGFEGTAILAESEQRGTAVLANNANKSYGVCLAGNNVFYTQPETTIFGVKEAGSEVATISRRLTNPRGCSWDGGDTVFVADRGANAVYSFASTERELGAAQLVKIVDSEDAFGVAVYSGVGRARPRVLGVMVALALSVQRVLGPAA